MGYWGSDFNLIANLLVNCIDKVNTIGRIQPMDIYFERNGDTFVWNVAKAKSNWHKHGVRFEEAASALLIRCLCW